jgi:ribonucleotide monophosphatase NagD (HAD superfamily)
MSLEQRGLFRHSLSRQPQSLDHAERQQKRAVLQLSDGLVVEGVIHLPPGTRPLDFLNRASETFIAVTNATITCDGRAEQAPFIAVNKAHVISVRDV